MKDISSTPEEIFHDINYKHYMIQYQGDIESEFEKVPGFYVTIINPTYAIISLKENETIRVNDPRFPAIVYIKPTEMYTLQDISPVDASQAGFLQLDLPLKLTGKDTIVGIIDSGIDYLNEELTDFNGNTRIECIWDQTIISNKEKKVLGENIVPFGTIYNKIEINDAIKANRQGNSPYEIVETKDEIGHGTKMSGIIGASGKNPKIKGVSPDCNFAVVKLIEDYAYKNIFDVKVPIYNITAIFSAIQFLYEYALNNSKPMVIYLPLGTNSGNHKGNGILEEYIESISTKSGIVLVTGAGNERNKGIHASGIITDVGKISTVELDVSQQQKNLIAEIWVDLPNIMTVEIVSPSGESSGEFLALINSTETHTYIFEKTEINVNFYLPEESSGDELIRILFYDLQPGIWKIRLIAKYVLSGTYNIWLLTESITAGTTNFTPSDPYGTITNPGSARSIVTVAAYNQNNNNLVKYSGMSFEDVDNIRIDLAAGGVNAITIAPNNEMAVANGTSVSAAVVAGVCALLFEWGIVDGNNPNMYSQTIKTYLITGTNKRSGDIYPNPQLGYGILNVVGIFENMT